MYLNNYQYLKNKETVKLFLLILFSLLIRIPVILMFGDSNLENEWGVLVNNLIINQTLAFDYLDPELDKFLLPNVWMPPLYAYYLYFFSFFNLEQQQYIQLILFSQIFLSLLSVVVFYKINKLFFSQQISCFGSLLFSLFPLYLYACGQISSVTLQVFLAILFLYFIFQFIKKRNFLSIFLLSFIGGLSILLRGEFVLILLISFLYLFFYFKITIKNISLMILIILITISPYLIRNIVVIDTITITKSLGYNLWKGNNPSSLVEGGVIIDENLKKEINNIPKDKFYGINFNKVFLDRATENIINEPIRYLTLFTKKFMSFLFIDIHSSRQNYYEPSHYLPVLLLAITSLIGIVLSDKKSNKLNYLILIYFVNIIIFSCFFILPRYKLFLFPFQIIFTNVLIEYISKRYFSRNE